AAVPACRTRPPSSARTRPWGSRRRAEPTARGSERRERIPAALDETSGRVAWPSIRAPGDPLAILRAGDDGAGVRPLDDVLADQRAEGRLNARCSRQTMAGAHVRGEQLASVLDDDGPEHGALGQGEPLPRLLEHRLLLAEQARERPVEIVEAHRFPPRRADI